MIGDTLYRYYAIRTDSLGFARDSSNILEVRTLSETSHDYVWQTITMGEWQSAFFDVWGSGENDVWVVGQLHQNGVWSKELNTFPMQNFLPRSVYAINEKERYVCGRGIMNGYSGHWARASVPLSPQFMKIRGSGANNIFAAGESSIAVHYNGVSWHTYSELFTDDNSFFYGIYCTGNKVFLVGETGDSKAKICIGTKQ